MQARIVRGIILAGVIGNFPLPAPAEAPEGADPALAPWFRSLRHPGTHQSCCDMSDCRMVQYRTAGDHYQAFIGNEFPRWSNAPYAWVDVPNENVLHRMDNPTGQAVACWFQGHVLCFIEGNGT